MSSKTAKSGLHPGRGRVVGPRGPSARWRSLVRSSTRSVRLPVPRCLAFSREDFHLLQEVSSGLRPERPTDGPAISWPTDRLSCLADGIKCRTSEDAMRLMWAFFVWSALPCLGSAQTRALEVLHLLPDAGCASHSHSGLQELSSTVVVAS
ncbi:hypothetical protein Mp_1g06300 [Marchantia polymorpha subsp. ruderalis]|uniref:Uncharacterized protein n=2 Tax=Marchantia polymorpha TaxID=3197 RepID=A0AAF6AM40_MARPO|nr:hypothetical protein MARPO_0043s0022 [Marchantia polymorpha]BBM97510.1 hypothetical protein Mp_1g06300 [Marchantia polymorpha subsp. ruderalis]|eukprot:PTQ39749.1 hypothetical protein MARPO_0043s0022 [Marchantia polymorpha]